MTEYSHLSFWERHEIARFRADGWSLARIAAAIGRGKWTVSRELKRNANKDGSYGPSSAEQRYIARRRRQALLDRMPELAKPSSQIPKVPNALCDCLLQLGIQSDCRSPNQIN